MSMFGVIVDPSVVAHNPEVHAHIARNFDDECHVMENVWCIRTNRTVDQVYHILADIPLIQNKPFLIIPVEGTWRSHHCPSFSECFDSIG